MYYRSDATNDTKLDEIPNSDPNLRDNQSSKQHCKGWGSEKHWDGKGCSKEHSKSMPMNYCCPMVPCCLSMPFCPMMHPMMMHHMMHPSMHPMMMHHMMHPMMQQSMYQSSMYPMAQPYRQMEDIDNIVDDNFESEDAFRPYHRSSHHHYPYYPYYPYYYPYHHMHHYPHHHHFHHR